ncbi:secondary thiamine-phosphate synthase enzyme YjbQ [Sediminicurvatus halobius]|uniref:Secondary thiamine-phosphate synthase n=1 Tax=Sediminicurvatus halobius TaxID=2182432 RepID=A0A2U2MW61_9GAMM|nr:secondary thiamine-phosphate synthase enzyme YjbQ [Spiribacter halobius]PWG61062.1 secondary thiamine-phosphate synthase [Spiribacter halobius]UEX76765.1 secondary thiamine-phosphate synthase enzyme YjbQ [Spiribacter halobius]
MHQQTLEFRTPGRGTLDITREVATVAREAGVDAGLAHVFIRHTSASLIICENADPGVRRDLERFTADWVPDGDPRFEHDVEGPDGMPAHIRSVFTQSGLSVPVSSGRLALGTWQGIFLWEHRAQPHRRQVVVTVQG